MGCCGSVDEGQQPATKPATAPATEPPPQQQQPQDGAAEKKFCMGKTKGKKCGFDVTGMNFCSRCGVVTLDGTFKPLPVPLVQFDGAARTCIHCATGLADVDFCPGCGIPAKQLIESKPLPLTRFGTQMLSPEKVELTGSTKDKLQQIVADKPYIDKEGHALYYYVQACGAAIAAENEDDATNALDNLNLGLANEERALLEAFRTFDANGNGVLSKSEVKLMLEYCGFPADDEDATLLLEGVADTPGSGDTPTVGAAASVGVCSYDNFRVFVGNRGGSGKLFHIRQQRIKARRGDFTSVSADMEEAVKSALLECGFNEKSQKVWKDVVSASEFEVTAGLEDCQKSALRHIRALAVESHERAMPYLLERVQKLGFTPSDLTHALLWIRDLAPLIVHINLDKIGEFLKTDTHYRNQFETRTSQGLLKPAARERWERRLFGDAYENAKPFDRPKYAVQNVFNDFRGVQGAKQYGDSYLVLKDVRMRSTFCPKDSANLPARRISVLDFYAHSLLEYSDTELKQLFQVAEGGAEHTGDSKAVIEQWGMYKEAQVHGPICLKDHVVRIVANDRHRPQWREMEDMAAVHGLKLTWMNEMESFLATPSPTRDGSFHRKSKGAGDVSIVPIAEE